MNPFVSQFLSKKNRFSCDSYFNQKIDHLPNLTKLTLGRFFDQSIDQLPKTLTNLRFYSTSEFSQPIHNLPDSLTKVTFGAYFNQPLKSLPNNLIRLNFDKNNMFNHQLDHLPNSLKYLFLGKNFNQKIANLPEKLLKLHFHENQNGHFDNEIVFLPKTLLSFQFYGKLTKKLDLPETLVSLKIGTCHQLDLNYLPFPKKLLHLHLVNLRTTDIVFPPNLLKITLENSENFPSNIFSESLEVTIKNNVLNNPKTFYL